MPHGEQHHPPSSVGSPAFLLHCLVLSSECNPKMGKKDVREYEKIRGDRTRGHERVHTLSLDINMIYS